MLAYPDIGQIETGGYGSSFNRKRLINFNFHSIFSQQITNLSLVIGNGKNFAGHKQWVKPGFKDQFDLHSFFLDDLPFNKTIPYIDAFRKEKDISDNAIRFIFS